MSYGGRRGVNVSQYIANLNTVTPPEDPLESPPNLEEDLALFTSNDFIDWDGSTGTAGFNQTQTSFNVNFEQPTNATGASVSEAPKMDFNLDNNYDFGDFGFQNPIVEQPMQPLPHTQHAPYPIAPSFASPSSAASPISPSFDSSSDKKRKLSQLNPLSQHHIDEAARQAAEEDKRRRNTAASARFRIKKKQREQALEKTAKEMSDKVSLMAARIQQLETENTWLKSLITEKNGGKVPSPDAKAKLQKHEESASERIGGSRTDGVGTEAEGVKA